MKRILLIILFCSQALGVVAENQRRETDSLLKLLPTMKHDSIRLKLLAEIVQMEQRSDESLQYTEMLLEEAKLQNDPYYASAALYFQVLYFYNTNEPDSVKMRLDPLETYSTQTNEWSYYCDAVASQINLYAYHGWYELAVDRAVWLAAFAKGKGSIRGQIGAYQALAYAYMGTSRWRDAKLALEEAYKLLPEQDNLVIDNAVTSLLIRLAYLDKDYPAMAKYLNEQASFLNKVFKEYPEMRGAYMNQQMVNYLRYAQYYIATKQPTQAAVYLNRASDYLSQDILFSARQLYETVFIDYDQLCGNYDKALARLEPLLVKAEVDDPDSYANWLQMKADLLYDAEHYQEALPIYQRSHILVDSLENVKSAKQTNQILTTYQADKATLDREQFISRIQLAILMVVILCGGVVIYILGYMSRIRKALAASELKTREATQEAAEANQIKHRFLANLNQNIRVPLKNIVELSQKLAEEEDMPETLRETRVQIVQQSTTDLLRLVNDVLDLSRLEARMAKFTIAAYPVNTLSTNAMTVVMQECPQIRIIQHNTTDDSVMICTDATRMQAALCSMLTYPRECKTERTVSLAVKLSDDGMYVEYIIINSPLADPAFKGQDVSIRHAINALLVEHFGGEYNVVHTTGAPTIIVTCPVDNPTLQE